MSLKVTFSRIGKAFVPCMLVVVACCGLLLGWGDTANASNKAADIVQDRAEQEFDRVAGEGSVNQIKGKVKEDIGRTQRQFGSDVEGAATQAEGKVQRDLGRAQEAADQATDAAEDKAQGLVDKVKDIFD